MLHSDRIIIPPQCFLPSHPDHIYHYFVRLKTFYVYRHFISVTLNLFTFGIFLIKILFCHTLTFTRFSLFLIPTPSLFFRQIQRIYTLATIFCFSFLTSPSPLSLTFSRPLSLYFHYLQYHFSSLPHCLFLFHSYLNGSSPLV